jgi:hypothetical protein
MKIQQEQTNTSHRLKRLYKAHVIEVTAIPVKTGGFTAHLSIIKDAGRYTDETPFQSGRIFTSVNEALEAGIEIGKRKIAEGFRPTTVTIDK